jgi:dipeptidyl aminopeptidase/acylaminoacyl peptidase
MKRLSCLSLIFILVFSYISAFAQEEQSGTAVPANIVVQGVPEIPQAVADRMNQYQQTRAAYFSDWNPNGPGMLITTRFGDTYQLHHVDHPGGARRQITFFKEPVNFGAYCPAKGKNGFLFSMDVGGGEFYQIYYYDLSSGKNTMLTDGKSRNESSLWSNNGKSFAYTSTKRNGKDNDIYLSNPDNPSAAKMIYQAEGSWGPVDWSPDDSRLLVINYISANESYYYILDSKTGQTNLLFPKSEEKVAYGGAMWSKDGKGVYYVTDRGSEFMQLHYWDLVPGKDEVITKEIPWDVEGFDLSRDGKMLVFVTNEDGMSKLRIIETKTKKELKLPALPVGQVSGIKFKPDNTTLALNIETPRYPGDVYSLDLKKMELARWTYSEVGGLNTDNFPVAQLIHYPTFDSVNRKPRTIPAFYFKPTQKSDKPFPVVIYIHGGPEGQYTPAFASTFQYWLNELGIAVLAPNVRGSTGYGKTYLKMDNDYLRENTVKDIGALLDWIARQPELDKNRVCVYGGSYGGYMVLACMFHYNDRLKAGIEQVGISNFVTFLENTQEYRRDLRRVEYGDERDPKMREFMISISPTTNANKITKPLLVGQGLNDPRVPAGEAEQIVGTIRKNGGEVWYILAKDEGHGFAKKVNRDYFGNVVSLFLEKFLLK